ncbi:DUF5983 family protein [Escherichia coli]|nr:DUF5983 family protein [Escherichia coli]MDY8752157.1 DUF5983 family protein [Escherichia coli]MDY8850510.1 DUF5983 family protein [Escherichia coli]
MKTISHNSTTSSVSVTAASGNDQPQLVATIVPDEQRISFWPQHFGLIPQWVTLEPRVFGWMDRLCEDYCGGIWNLYTLNNGGAFMAPEPDDDDDETWVLFNAMNGTCIRCSTAHITETDNAWLYSLSHQTNDDGESEWIHFTGSGYLLRTDAWSYPVLRLKRLGLSKTFRCLVVTLTRRYGVSLIHLDASAECLPGLPTFNW